MVFNSRLFICKKENKQLDRARQRRIDARERRQESLHNRGVTSDTTIVKLPQPRNMIKDEVVKVKKTIPEVPVVAKRGRGRPPKQVADNNKNSKKQLVGKKTIKGKEKR
jgi:hypothetical protein